MGAGVETSLDRARTSACATVCFRPCDRRGWSERRPAKHPRVETRGYRVARFSWDSDTRRWARRSRSRLRALREGLCDWVRNGQRMSLPSWTQHWVPGRQPDRGPRAISVHHLRQLWRVARRAAFPGSPLDRTSRERSADAGPELDGGVEQVRRFSARAFFDFESEAKNPCNKCLVHSLTEL